MAYDLIPSVEAYEISMSADLIEQADYMEVLGAEGYSDAFLSYGYERGLLLTSVLALEAAGAPKKPGTALAIIPDKAPGKALAATGDASHTAAHAATGAFIEKLKGWSAGALKKMGDFAKYIEEKVGAFSSDMGEKVGAAKTLKTAAKVKPVAEVAAGVGILTSAAAAIGKISQLIKGLFSSPQALDEAKKGVTTALASIKSPAGSVTAVQKGSKIQVGFEALEDTAAKAATTGWTKNILGNLVTRFSSGSKTLWTAFSGFAGAIKSVIASGATWAGKLAKGAIGLGDKGAGKAISHMNAKAALGGFKGILYGMACMAFVTWLVNTILKVMRNSLNAASNTVKSTVDGVCGPA